MNTPKCAWVMPSIDPDYRAACMASMAWHVRRRTFIVDNIVRNHGVAASWNIGIDYARAVDADWLIILSESIRFGPAGGADFEAGLAGKHGLVTAVCDQTCTEVHDTGQGFCRRGYGFHLIGLSMETVATVGRFDEIFYPAWWEDADYRRRMGIARRHVGDTIGFQATDQDDRIEGVAAHLQACEHTLATGLVGNVGWWTTAGRYKAKWGGEHGHEIWDRPYGDPALDWTWTGAPPGDVRR